MAGACFLVDASEYTTGTRIVDLTGNFKIEMVNKRPASTPQVIQVYVQDYPSIVTIGRIYNIQYRAYI